MEENVERDLVLRALRTPVKHGGLVLAPSHEQGRFDSLAVDGPFLLAHQGRYYMTFVGWDGTGYQTGLAVSDDLIRWQKLGIILGRGPKGSVTAYNAALTCIVRDNELFGPSTPRRIGGRYVGTYHAYPKPGYEAGPAVIGLCHSDDLRLWELGDPILEPSETWAWEAGGLYKSWLMEADGVYYLFYNAKNRTSGPWREQIGLATSTDLSKWERYGGNPVIRNGGAGEFDDLFASDPCVLRHEGAWIMFYYGNCSDGHARDGAAVSQDLLHWEKSGEVLVDVGPEGACDSRYAHKPGIITRNGVLYHFYCAVAPAACPRRGGTAPKEARGISFARS